MNTKSLLLIAALCGTTPVSPLLAQSSGGTGGTSGSSGGSAGTSAGSTASGSTSSSTSPSSNGQGTSSTPSTATGTTVSPATPNTNSSMPSRSVLNTESPGNPGSAKAPQTSSLPPGLTVEPAQPGVSPVSGLPVSNLPAVSRGTAPLGPDAVVPPATSPASTAEAATQVRIPGATATTEPTTSAAPLQTNTLVGLGTTTIVPTPPPAMPTEVTPRRTPNEAGMVWIDGHYSWLGGEWTWVNGTWQRPPSEGATWIHGSYDAQNKRWTEGHWEQSTNPAPRAREPVAPQR